MNTPWRHVEVKISETSPVQSHRGPDQSTAAALAAEGADRCAELCSAECRSGRNTKTEPGKYHQNFSEAPSSLPLGEANRKKLIASLSPIRLMIYFPIYCNNAHQVTAVTRSLRDNRLRDVATVCLSFLQPIACFGRPCILFQSGTDRAANHQR